MSGMVGRRRGNMGRTPSGRGWHRGRMDGGDGGGLLMRKHSRALRRVVAGWSSYGRGIGIWRSLVWVLGISVMIFIRIVRRRD